VRALVTGGAGFIGSHLVDRLLHDGHEVAVLDNLSSGRRENVSRFGDDVELIEGDIRSLERATHAVRGCEVVFHQAALPSVPRSVIDPLTSHGSNVDGTLNILIAARDAGVRRLVFASSSSVYGANPQLPKDESMQTLPISPYAVAKLCAEGYCRAFHEVYGLETVALRYFNIFGPWQDPESYYAAVIPRFITAFLERRPPRVFGDGEQSRDFTYVGNAVEANIRAAAAPADVAAGNAYNVACGESVTLNGLLQELRALTGIDLPAHYEPPRAGDVRDSLADLRRTRADLGYEVQIDFGTGLERTFEYYASERAAAAAGHALAA
jgi:UDP-glucose 4-epimerase